MSVSFEEPLNYYGEYTDDVSTTTLDELGNTPVFVDKELNNVTLIAGTSGADVSYAINGITAMVFEQSTKEHHFTNCIAELNTYRVSFAGIEPGLSTYMTATFEGLTAGERYWLVVDQVGLELEDGHLGTYQVLTAGGQQIAEEFVPTVETINSLDTSYITFVPATDTIKLRIYPGNNHNDYCRFNTIYINKAHTSTALSFYGEITDTFNDVVTHIRIPANSMVTSVTSCKVFNNTVHRTEVCAGFYHVHINEDLFMMLDTSVGFSTTTYGVLNNLVGYADPYHVRCRANKVDEDTYTIVPQVLIEETWKDFEIADFPYVLSYKRIAEF